MPLACFPETPAPPFSASQDFQGPYIHALRQQQNKGHLTAIPISSSRAAKAFAQGFVPKPRPDVLQLIESLSILAAWEPVAQQSGGQVTASHVPTGLPRCGATARELLLCRAASCAQPLPAFLKILQQETPPGGPVFLKEILCLRDNYCHNKT